MPAKKAQPEDTEKTVVDPSPSKFRQQALFVAVVLVILGVIVFFIASELAGGVIALLAAVFGLSAQVVRGLE